MPDIKNSFQKKTPVANPEPQPVASENNAENERRNLLPLSTISTLIKSDVLRIINNFEVRGSSDAAFLYDAIRAFVAENKKWNSSMETAILEISNDCSNAAKKYNENSWKKNSVSYYIDNGICQYLKWHRGDADEAHDKAFIWNMVWAIWVIENAVAIEPVSATHEADEESSQF